MLQVRGRLLTSFGETLDGDAAVGATWLRDGDVLTLQVGSVRVAVCGGTSVIEGQADQAACAAVLGDGSVVTWGHHEFRVKVQLENVVDIQASFGAFAAILADGSAVTWGKAKFGGNSQAGPLHSVQHIQASYKAFAAIRGWICGDLGRCSAWW